MNSSRPILGKDAVQPEVSRALLKFLRRSFGNPEIDFRISPALVAVGTEAEIILFTLQSVPQYLSGPLVLRISSDLTQPIDATVEHVIQNSVCDQGFPAPRVLISSVDGAELGRPFTIMTQLGRHPAISDRVLAQLDPQLAIVHKDGHTPAKCTRLRLHLECLARLHSLDIQPLHHAFEAYDVPIDRRKASIRFTNAEQIIGRRRIDSLQPLMGGLVKNRPDSIGATIVHGDPHEGNLIFEDGQIIGMLDWSAAGVRHPESDLGVLCGYRRCLEPPSTSPEEQDKFNQKLIAEYERHRPANPDLVYYYETEFLVSLVASIIEQRHRRAGGDHPPHNPILDDSATLPRVESRLKSLLQMRNPAT